MAQQRHNRHIVLASPVGGGGSSRDGFGHGYSRVTKDFMNGKVITEQKQPIMEQVTKDHRTGKVTNEEVWRKNTMIEDFKKATITKVVRDTTKTIVSDGRRQINGEVGRKKTTTEDYKKGTVTKDVRNTEKTVVRDSSRNTTITERKLTKKSCTKDYTTGQVSVKQFYSSSKQETYPATTSMSYPQTARTLFCIFIP